MAQNKAVAVTEVVDKEDKVSYATEIMVRTMLTAAISMKQGYTAYDRVDLQSIMSEQNFQRTGLVDDATIKRLGEMTGASLILMPEVAMSDDGKIYVAVKMLDVTTAQTLMSTGELMGSSSAEVEEGCRALTAKVLGVRSGTSSTTVGSDEPVTLFGYLRVFPTDIGEFQTLPAQLLYAINKKATYGYDSWRLPTTEELSIMRANSHLIPNFRNVDYLCSDSSVKGFARLVTTDMSVREKEERKKEEREKEAMIRKKSILNLLGIHDNYSDYVLLDSIVVVTHKIKFDLSLGKRLDLQMQHPNKNFVVCTNEMLIRKYAKYEDYPCLIDWYQGYGTSDSYRVKYTCPYYFSVIDVDGMDKVDEKDQIIWYYSHGTSYYGDNFIYNVLYKASLPSEELIRKEMQKIKGNDIQVYTHQSL